jgi:hypothetical protein
MALFLALLLLFSGAGHGATTPGHTVVHPADDGSTGGMPGG